MKYILVLIMSLMLMPAAAQRESAIEITGSEFVVLTYSDFSRKTGDVELGIKFVNTTTGQIKKVELPQDNFVELLRHVRIDPLQVSKIIVLVRNESKIAIRKGQDMSELHVYSPNGTLEKLTVLPNFTGHEITVNQKTGKMVLASADSGKIAPEQKQQIIIYDLLTNQVQNPK